jgi:hypothetical protein
MKHRGTWTLVHCESPRRSQDHGNVNFDGLAQKIVSAIRLSPIAKDVNISIFFFEQVVQR